MTASHLATLTGHTGSVHAVAISPGGTRLATASNDRSVRECKSNGGSDDHGRDVK
jgi:WD40 repeat protein